MADLIVRSLGLQSYLPIWQEMQTFTDTRDAQTPDEIWVLEHHPVFTQGQAGKPEHLLNPSNIPVIQTDRGGQVTYHGPGQLVVYLLLDLRRLKIGVRDVVTLMETAVIDQLARIGINAKAKEDAPGVYVKGEKVASLGLRVRRGCTFHGLALNVDMDLMPFQQINPCGYAGLQMTQVAHFAPNVKIAELSDSLVNYFTTHLGYQTIEHCQTLLSDVTQLRS